MKPLLAILIPTTPDRQQLLDRLMAQLDKQRVGHDCIVIINDTAHSNAMGPTTGKKRNQLLDEARHHNASHISFFDSDDIPSSVYIQRNMEGVNANADVVELWGQYYEHGKQMNPFHHSIKYDHWFQDNKFYYRMPNHLNCVKLEHLNDIQFQDKTIGEDFWYSEAMRLSGLLKNQYPVNEILYCYFAGRRNHALEPGMALKRGTKL